jgi:phosphomannomutase/phosphoglucomutase
LGELPQYFIEKDKIECPNNLKGPVLEAFADSVKSLNVDTTDGVKFLFEDKSSILIRPSGTEPIYRFYAEGKTRQRATQLIKKYKTQLSALIKKMKA